MNKFVTRRLITTQIKNIIPDVTKIKEYNMQYIDVIDLKIRNPKTVSITSIFKTHIFEATVSFKKEDFIIYQSFYNNDFTKLTEDINDYISRVIKL